MKLRHSLSIFGLVAMLGLGVGVGLANGQKPVAEAKAANNVTVYFVKDDFTPTHAYAWNAADLDNKNAAWPGVAVSPAGENTYSVSIDISQHNMVIFNDNEGKHQTADLRVVTSHPYYFDTTEKWCLNDGTALPDGYYLTGSYNNWTISSDWKMTLETTSNRPYIYNKTFSVTAAGSVEMKATYCENTAVKNWYGASNRVNHDVTIPGSGNAWASGNFGIYFGAAGSVTVDLVTTFGGTDDESTYHIFNPCTLKAKLGSTSYPMQNYAGNFEEYIAVLSSIPTGSELSFIKSDESVQPYVANADGSNNLKDGNIIVGGNINVYYNTTGSHSVWVSGYTGMHHFISGNGDTVDGLLADTISGSTCANPTTIDRSGNPAASDASAWKYYSDQFELFNSYEATVFQTAIDDVRTLGIPLSSSAREDELLECAERYVWLMEKFDGQGIWAFENENLVGGVLNIAAGRTTTFVSPLSVASDNNMMLIIAIAISSVAVLALIGGYFYFRKRKEDR